MNLLQAVTLTTTKVILAAAHYFVREVLLLFFVFETSVKGCIIRISWCVDI